MHRWRRYEGRATTPRRPRIDTSNQELASATQTAKATDTQPTTRVTDGQLPTGAFLSRGNFGRLLMIPLGIAALFSQRHWPQGTVGSDVFIFLGLMFLLAGLAVRTWATIYVGGRKSKELVTTGPYSLCRHPLYLGSLLIGLSVPVFLQSLTLGLCILVIAPLMYRPVIREEERILAANFGDSFREFQARVPRAILPQSLRHLRTSPKLTLDVHALRLHLGRSLRVMLLLPGAMLASHLQANGIFPVWFQLP